jgi:hypothetical protein
MFPPIDPDVDDATASGGVPAPLLAEEAFDRYAAAVKARAVKVADLHRVLAAEADVMRVLHLSYLDVGPVLIADRNSPEAIREARTQGWITGRRWALTKDGLMKYWEWKDLMVPLTREPEFQALWRDVTAW